MKRLQESQIVRYVLTGGLTTLINYIIYFSLQLAGADYLAANCAAWLGAVTFAFFANRQMVFRSRGDKGKEFAGFFSLRLATLAAETALLFAMVDMAGIGAAVSKVAVSAVTTVLNYAACKYGIFKEGGVSHE